MLTGDRVEPRKVTTGRTSATGVEISKGLTAGERVVSGPPEALRNLKAGQRVRVMAP